MTENRDAALPPTKRYKKIPIYVVEEHNEALQFIYSAIGGKKLPLEGTTLLHLDAHPDMLIDRKLRGNEARSGRKLLPLLQIENWIVPAAAAGHIGRVVWLRPPWAKQISDGTRQIKVGDHPTTGLLRVDSKEPYYLSDALYYPKLINERVFTLTVAELSDYSQNSDDNHVQKLAANLSISQPYVLDIDLDFFSTGNPFLGLYENIGLYDRLEPIFNFKLPENDDAETVEKVIESRERQLDELEKLFQHLEENNTLKNYDGPKSQLLQKSNWREQRVKPFVLSNLFQHLEENNTLKNYDGPKSQLLQKVSDLAKLIQTEAGKHNEKPDWWAVFAGGCTRDQEGLPCHISSDEEIQGMVKNALVPLLKNFPPPVLITVARSTDDGYCPPDQVDYIQTLVLKILSEVYDTDDPELHYLTVKTTD